ncbi:unnamed protein product [Meloidogyne enterolobii]|uniref:Uncharacterized protein n=1 Tax=Meloidogyne enterolobii TaxID=390850 RepID=A0ACB0ZG35_MELEN
MNRSSNRGPYQMPYYLHVQILNLGQIALPRLITPSSRRSKQELPRVQGATEINKNSLFILFFKHNFTFLSYFVAYFLLFPTTPNLAKYVQLLLCYSA